ncbi:MAG: hypothetical protein CSB47_10635 [Proteobacteria bacterium]|nr:MAG: hypothetical protein CSB47_10635 [Pseudomonadota bacterium]
MEKQTKPMSRSHHERAAQSMENFVLYVSSPWRVVWVNFIAGVFRGLGAVIGASIVIAIIIWLLSLFTQMPLVGKYAKDVEDIVSGYVNEVNYNDEFERIENVLNNIETLLRDRSTLITSEQADDATPSKAEATAEIN